MSTNRGEGQTIIDPVWNTAWLPDCGDASWPAIIAPKPHVELAINGEIEQSEIARSVLQAVASLLLHWHCRRSSAPPARSRGLNKRFLLSGAPQTAAPSYEC
jgi:hypothetical protein